MPNSKDTTLVEGVRLSPSDIKKLQVLALVFETTVVGLIREAVEKHITTVYASEEFRTTLNQMKPGFARSFVEELMGKKSKPARKPRATRKHKL